MAAKKTILICIASLLLTAALFCPHINNAQAAFAPEMIQVELCYEKARFTYLDKRIEPSNHLIADEFYTRKINGSYDEKRAVMSRCVSMGGTYKNAVLYTMPKIEFIVDKAIRAVEKEAEDSQISFKPNSEPMFTITREKEGRRIDEEELYMQIYSALLFRPQVKVNLRAIAVKPEVTAADNIKLTNLRARYSTGYEHSSENRKHNIGIALKRINGAVIEPEEVFSFNKRVGARNEKNGYKLSKIILNGKYEEGIGGGVCQVSTTVYNAALLAGLEIISARAHSLECAYELPSFDCMVNASWADLKFKNTDKTKLFIKAYADENRAVVEIYGQKPEYTIKRKSEIIERKEPPETETIIDNEYKHHEQGAESGAQKVVNYPHGKLKSVGYLLYYDSRGYFIKKQKIRSDTYKEQKGLIAIAP